MQPKVKSKKTQIGKSKQKKEFSFPLEKENFMIIGLGIALLIVGYFLMSENSVDGFLPTVVAPILLVAGYCVVIPYGILKKPKSEISSVPEESIQEAETSNIKTS
ncbi:MAG TPA: DUF3098 domain-containing protein [Ignavibacteria bacterium]|nr:DUF3098 domain-containing protein [Ignavibacteria bacterium]HAX50112.1 hypothetical protein [Bacteroidota bacterium]HRE10837.1 DUF3098 domain-containing protein [Ignavibacteria bacterium]HRF66074.1 DUF3098 domain-containing protein [Ignavibacteria bacterium]HRJ04839.1 DUF3098 domain-containing protein [Ignavibacteria bacterium]